MTDLKFDDIREYLKLQGKSIDTFACDFKRDMPLDEKIKEIKQKVSKLDAGNIHGKYYIRKAPLFKLLKEYHLTRMNDATQNIVIRNYENDKSSPWSKFIKSTLDGRGTGEYLFEQDAVVDLIKNISSNNYKKKKNS